MTRYEFSKGTSNKFWEIERAGAAITTRWGRIGSTARSKTKAFASAAAAKQAHDKLLHEKMREGYRLVDGKAKPVKCARCKQPIAADEPRTFALDGPDAVDETHPLHVRCAMDRGEIAFWDSGISKATGKTTCIRCGKAIASGQPSLDLYPDRDDFQNYSHRGLHQHLACAALPAADIKALGAALAGLRTTRRGEKKVSRKLRFSPQAHVRSAKGKLVTGDPDGAKFSLAANNAICPVFSLVFAGSGAGARDVPAYGAVLGDKPAVRWEVHKTIGVDSGRFGLWTAGFPRDDLDDLDGGMDRTATQGELDAWVASTAYGDGAWITLMGYDAKHKPAAFLFGDGIDFELAAALGVQPTKLGRPPECCRRTPRS